MGQKLSLNSYMARGVLHPIFGCQRMHLLSQLISNFQAKVGRTAGVVTSLVAQLVNSRAPELAIYLCTYLRASFHHSGVKQLMQITATRLVLMAVIRLVNHKR